jgi:phosphoribosylanthranilate isomerase
MAIWIKICGITRLDDAQAALAAGADAIGLNFWPGSKRYCEPERAKRIVQSLPMGALVYGVFVDQPREKVEAIVRTVGLGGVQFHGSEPVEEADGWHVPVIRAVRATSRERVMEEVARRPRLPEEQDPAMAIDVGREYRLMIDSAAGGGSGVAVDDAALAAVDLHDVILAGGLTPLNVAAAVGRFHPFGVDTASGVEVSPGIKDPQKIARFVTEARSTAA